jgi:hypothetical protein
MKLYLLYLLIATIAMLSHLGARRAAKPSAEKAPAQAAQ